jgi:hypothetical protein
MSLGIVFKSPEGIVLAADSRVTLTVKKKQSKEESLIIPATFDNATKLLKIKSQNFVGAVTYGIAAIGMKEPRTANSYIPEFEEELTKNNSKRLSVKDFSVKLSNFFMEQWKNSDMPKDLPPGNDMRFLIGGYDEKATYGSVFEVIIPSRPNPKPFFENLGMFGIVYDGQKNFVKRLLNGYDDEFIANILKFLNLSEEKKQEFMENLKKSPINKIPYAFLPLQDCVDISIFLIRTTILMQKWHVDIRGVGGAIDVAIITKTDGFRQIQEKDICGENIMEVPI